MTPAGGVPPGAGSVITVFLLATGFSATRSLNELPLWVKFSGRAAVAKPHVVGVNPAAPAELFATGSNLQGCEKVAAQETAIQTTTSRWKKFFREVKAELKKVTWPNKQELISYSGVVFVSVVAVAILIWIIDTGLNKALEMIIR